MRMQVVIWACLAAGLIAAEVMLPDVFLLWLGLAAAGVLGLVLLFPGLSPLWQAVAFVVISFALVPAYRHFFRKRDTVSDQPLLNKRAAQMVGKSYPLHSAIVHGTGRIQHGDALWTVTGPDLPLGARVRITGVDSMTLTVVPDDGRN